MLPKKNRVGSRTLVLKLNSARIRVRTHLLQIALTPAEGFRVMVIVGKKIYKKAHDRNTVRRRVYSALPHESIEEFAGYAIQIRLHKSGLLDYTYQQLCDEILDGLQKLGQRIKHTAK